MTAATRDDAVATLRRASLVAGSRAWELRAIPRLADLYERESDRLWERSEQLKRAEVAS